jgi:hypothetical protein
MRGGPRRLAVRLVSQAPGWALTNLVADVHAISALGIERLRNSRRPATYSQPHDTRGLSPPCSTEPLSRRDCFHGEAVVASAGLTAQNARFPTKRRIRPPGRRRDQGRGALPPHVWRAAILDKLPLPS